MFRVLGLFAVVGASAYIALNNGMVAGFDLNQIPLQLVGLFLATCGIVYSLRLI